jgi:hypothetical protein
MYVRFDVERWPDDVTEDAVESFEEWSLVEMDVLPAVGDEIHWLSGGDGSRLREWWARVVSRHFVLFRARRSPRLEVTLEIVPTDEGDG